MMWRRTGTAATFGLLTSSWAWATPPSALLEHQSTLGVSFGLLTVAVVGLAFLEYRASKGRNLDLEIDRLAAAAAQRQARVNSDASSLLEDDTPVDATVPVRRADVGVGSAPPPPPGSPPPPPPPARAVAPPPPPPPPPPPSENSESFASRLGATSEEVAIPAAKPTPISFGAPMPPPSTESGAASPGGWADLLQRVRSNEEAPNPFGAGASPPLKNSSETEPAGKPAGGGDAWEALLRKTAGGSGESSSPFAKSAVNLPSNSPFTPGNTGVPTANPESGDATASGDADDNVLPDFVKKASRTISLDLSKGGTSSNPFQKPPQ